MLVAAHRVFWNNGVAENSVARDSNTVSLTAIAAFCANWRRPAAGYIDVFVIMRWRKLRAEEGGRAPAFLSLDFQLMILFALPASLPFSSWKGPSNSFKKAKVTSFWSRWPYSQEPCCYLINQEGIVLLCSALSSVAFFLLYLHCLHLRSCVAPIGSKMALSLVVPLIRSHLSKIEK